MMTTLTTLVNIVMTFFTKTKTVQQEVKSTNADGQIELNKIEVQKNSLHWRNIMGTVFALVIAYNWLIVPIFDALGIVLIQVPISELIPLITIMLGGM
ncbi:hypothetical protein VC636_25575 [Citrobacter freundii]|uniref:hypothetical protein n=1 Tax=Citrobacter freundii TaxID=546 RepID=UPI00292C37B3|nr:hypothetical protein [Citrobacter freundii]MDV0678301.1 hypothetical protein [Citrobacter freundii]MDV0860793.1 hypothetical protein [Citrobacter freundii]MEB0577834.1 hypothetical protein [Citrobacter freundii]MEB0714280.1 hypothetical protein [Citrobacter freundii]